MAFFSFFFFFKQKTAYDIVSRDWSSDVCSSDLPAYILDQKGRVIAELTQPVQQPHEDEEPQVQAPTPQPEATQAAQPAGAGPLLGPALHERIAQAVRPVLEELRQGNAQARQSGE